MQASIGLKSLPRDLASLRERFPLAALDVWAVVLPAAWFVEFQVVGRLILSELLALALLPWLWRARDRPRMPRWFLALWSGWLLSQVITDLAVRSAFTDYARGWAKILFTLTTFAAFLVLASTPRRARLCAVGLAIGGFLGFAVAPHEFAAGDPWKWGLALPIGLVLAAAVSGGTSLRAPWVPIGAFAVFAAANFVLGFRSLGGMAGLTAAYLLIGVLIRGRWPLERPSLRRAALGAIALVAIGTTVFVGYDAAARLGILGSDAQAKHDAQSGPLGVLIGGRYEVLASSQAVIDSPIVGHGSWARDMRYVDLLNERLHALGLNVPTAIYSDGLIPTHSYLMGAWVESGLLGGLFWLAILLLAGWLMANLYATPIALGPLLVFATTLLTWDILFSPYGNNARVFATYEIALCLLGIRLLNARDRSGANGATSSVQPAARAA